MTFTAFGLSFFNKFSFGNNLFIAGNGSIPCFSSLIVFGLFLTLEKVISINKKLPFPGIGKGLFQLPEKPCSKKWKGTIP